MSFRVKVAVALGAGLLLLACVGFLSYQREIEFDSTADWVTHTYEVRGKLRTLQTDLDENEANRFGYLMSENEQYMSAFVRRRGKIERLIPELVRLTADNPPQQKRIAGLSPLIEQRLTLMNESAALAKQMGRNAPQLAGLLLRTHQLSQQIREQIADAQKEEDGLLAKRRQAGKATEAKTKRIIALGYALAFLLLAAGNVVVFREISERKRAEETLRQSREQYHLLFDSIPHPVWVYDFKTLAILDVNRSAVQDYGYSREEFLSLTLKDIRPPEDIPALLENVASAPSSTESSTAWKHRKKDGTLIDVEITSHPLIYRGGDARLVVATNITVRKRAEEALKASEQRLNLALDAAQLGIWELDLVNDKAYRSLRHDQIFGYESLQPDWGQEIFLTHVVPEDRESVRKSFKKAFAIGDFSMECPIVWPDKSIHWISTQGRSFRNDKGDPVRMMGTVADITGRKEGEIALERHRLELIRSNAELASVNNELEAFTYSVSHDLRAPLRHIDGFSRILAEEYKSNLDDAGRHYLERIVYGAQQMGCLVDDLLNLSRIGRQELARKNVDLDSLLRNIVADLSDSAGQTNIEWTMGPLPAVDCDPGLMKLAFTNLLSNAIKFSASRERPMIEVGRVEEDGERIFFVRDNGVGFDPKYADKLFGVFQRLHRQEDFEGTGIGLATVQRIIHKHGGRVWAESKPDEGATFYFTLARKQAMPQEVGIRNEGVL